MRKYLIAILILFASNHLKAERLETVTSNAMGSIPSASMFNSEAIYYTSSTCNATTLATAVISTTSSTSLYLIRIASAGTESSLAVYDGSFSTTAARKISGFILTTPVRDLFYNVGITSGIAISNQGTVPACIDIIYTSR